VALVSLLGGSQSSTITFTDATIMALNPTN